MPLTIIPMAINLMTGFMLWQSELSLIAKIVITILIVLKYASFFYAALIAEPDVPRYVGLSFCAAINIGLIIYNIVVSQWFVLTGIAMCLILLCVWSFAAVFSFEKKEGKE